MTRAAKDPDRSERLSECLVAALARHRLAVLAVWLAVTLGLGSGIAFLSFTADSRVYFGTGNPERLALEEVERHHGRFASAIVMVEAGDGTILTPAGLAAVRDAARAVGRIEGVAAVRAVTDFRATGTQIEASGAIPQAQAEALRQAWEADPAALLPLVSRAGDVAGIVALLPTGEARHVAAAGAIRDLLAPLRLAAPGFTYRLSGDAVMDRTFVEAILQDILWLAPLQGLLIILLLLVMLRCIWSMLALIAVLAAACLTTMGLAGWAGLDLNGATSGTPMILLGLAVAACIHILMAWQQAFRDAEGRADGGPDGRMEAMAISIRQNAFPVFLASFTTVASFLCLNFSDSPPFRELGNLIAFGLSVTFLAAFSLLPVLLLALPARGARGREGMERAMARLGARIMGARGWLTAALVLVVAGSALGVTQIRFDDRFAHYFSERFAFRTDTDFMEARLTGLTVLEFSLPARGEGGVAAPDYLKGVDRFAGWLRGRPGVDRVTDFAGIAKRIGGFLFFDKSADGLPETLDGGREVLAAWRNFAGDGAPADRPVTRDGRRSIVAVTLNAVSSRQIREFAEQAEAWLAENSPQIAAPPTGMALLSAYLSQRNTSAMALGTVVALALVSLILLLALRSLRLGLLSLVPNLVPMLMAYGAWGLWAGEATFAATVVMAMTFGIVVDDSVHLLSKYDRVRRRGLSVAEAVPESFRTVGVALVATTLAIASGFFVLSLSGFLVNRDLGLLTVLVLASALFVVLFFVPPLLALFDRRERRAGS